MYALILGTQIVELAQKPFPVSPEMQWVDIGNNTVVPRQDTYVKGQVVPYVAPSDPIPQKSAMELRLEVIENKLGIVPPA